VSRLAGLANLGAPVVACNEAHRFLVAEQYARTRVRCRGRHRARTRRS
jgi:mannose-1-phosphate guanylyltransferase